MINNNAYYSNGLVKLSVNTGVLTLPAGDPYEFNIPVYENLVAIEAYIYCPNAFDFGETGSVTIYFDGVPAFSKTLLDVVNKSKLLTPQPDSLFIQAYSPLQINLYQSYIAPEVIEDCEIGIIAVRV